MQLGLHPLAATALVLSVAAGTSAAVPAPERTQQGRDVFEQLAPEVQSGALAPQIANLLSNFAGRPGMIGELEAVHAAHALERLAPAARQQWGQLIQAAPSDLARIFLYKALASGHSLAEIATFASSISSWSNEQMLQGLTLADARALKGGEQNGVMQQFANSCVEATMQAMRGEFDPIYAQQVRFADGNQDIHAANGQNPLAINPQLAREQGDLIRTLARGVARPRNHPQGAVNNARHRADIYNSITARTGLSFRYTSPGSPRSSPGQRAEMLDGIAAQVSRGIPTPLGLSDLAGTSGHAVLVLGVEGKGPGQLFLVHDPMRGLTFQLPRSEIVQNRFGPVVGDPSLVGYFTAQPAATPAG